MSDASVPRFELNAEELAAAGETLSVLLACNAEPFASMNEEALEWLRGLIVFSVNTDRPH